MRIWLWLGLLVGGLCPPGCSLDEPLTGRPCDDDDDCAGGGRTHYCVNDAPEGIPHVCVPGERPVPALDNRAPVIGTNVVVVKSGTSHEARLAVTDPDDDPLTFTLRSAPEGLFGLLVLDGDVVRYEAGADVDGVVRDPFRIEVSDGAATVAFNLLVVVIGVTDGATFSTWTGAVDGRFDEAANWLPADRVPDAAIDVLLTDEGGGSALSSGMGQVQRLFVTPGHNPAPDGLSVFGDAAVAAGKVRGPVTFAADGPPVEWAGQFSAVTVKRRTEVVSAVAVDGDLVHQGGSLRVAAGAALSVSGDLVQLAGAGDVVFVPDEDALAPPTLVVGGAMTLVGTVRGSTPGRLLLGGDVTAPGFSPGPGTTVVFTPGEGTRDVDVPASAGAYLRATVIEAGARVRFVKNSDMRGTVELRGALGAAPGTVTRVIGALIVFPTVEVPEGEQGQVVANVCVRSPFTPLPAHITCLDGDDVLDAGAWRDSGGDEDPDAGGPDAGLDAGMDAGLDAGVDAGLDAGGPDAGLDAGADAGLDAGPDAGLDAGGADVAAPDGGVAAVCGDGLVEGDEQCDDGDTSNGNACRNDCTWPVCGDGFLQPGEGCDDGNPVGGDGCDPGCAVEAATHECVGLTTSSCAPLGAVVRVPQDVATIGGAYGSVPPGGVIYVATGLYAGATSLNGKNVTIHAEVGTTLISSAQPQALRVQNANVTVRGLQLIAIGGDAARVDSGSVFFDEVTLGPSDGIGLRCLGGVVTMSRSRVQGNQELGLEIDCPGYVIEGNVIVDNGAGGVELLSDTGLFHYNTVMNNPGDPGAPGGVECAGAGDGAVLAGNVIWGNGGLSAVGATCAPVGNTIDEAWPDNLMLNCGLVAPDYHLAPTSPCVDAASANPTLVDLDGDIRPFGPAPDLGADEVR